MLLLNILNLCNVLVQSCYFLLDCFFDFVQLCFKLVKAVQFVLDCVDPFVKIGLNDLNHLFDAFSAFA